MIDKNGIIHADVFGIPILVNQKKKAVMIPKQIDDEEVIKRLAFYCHLEFFLDKESGPMYIG